MKVTSRFIKWLLGLTLILRCFTIALLVHAGLLLAIGAIKVTHLIKSFDQVPPSGPFEGLLSPEEPPIHKYRLADQLPLGQPLAHSQPDLVGAALGSGGGSPVLGPDTEILRTIGVEADLPGATHQRLAGNFTGLVAPSSLNTTKLLVGTRSIGCGKVNWIGGRPGSPIGTTLDPSQRPPEPTENAVLAGLRWLKANQNTDGSWDCPQSKSAGTALAVLAFLGHGETADSKEFGQTVQRAQTYLLGCLDNNGLVKDKNMYAQGVVTLALAEGYAMTAAPVFCEQLTKAVKVILAAQKAAKKNPAHEGGWRYTVSSADADTSVSGWMIMALKSAHMAGLDIPKESLEQATKYLWNLYDDNGGFGYADAKRSLNMTGVGVLCQQFLGQGRDPRLNKALDYLASQKMSWEQTSGNWVLYGWYYTTQAMFQAGGKHWRAWEPQLRKTMVQAQAADGHWAPPPKSGSENNGLAYSTALSCLILEVYYRYLPIYREMEKGNTHAAVASAR